MSDVTPILFTIEQGDRQAAAQLLPLVYDALRELARRRLAREAPGHSLQATALVHEAYLRLVGNSPSAPGEPAWANRRHFLAAAAEAMRRILIDNARRKRRPKHGGDRQRLALDEALTVSPREDLLALNEALGRLAVQEPIKAELVKLRYFAGLSLEEAAACLRISPATAKRYWVVARAWLFDALSEPGERAPD